MSTTPDYGHVYVVQMQDGPIYKIGRTTDVPRRMSDFGILLPFPYRLVFARQTDRARWAEGILHSEYDHVRTNGEWFALTEPDLARVNRLLLYWQASDLFNHLVQRLAEHADSANTAYLGRLGGMIARAAKRIDRRESTCASWPCLPLLEAGAVQ
jgi:hypothetical protein